MRKENKMDIIKGSVTIGIILLIYLFIKVTEIIPTGILLAILLLSEILIAIPLFNSLVFKAYNQKVNLLENFIPFWNYTLTFRNKIVCNVFAILSLLLFLTSFVPSIYTIFGTTFILKVDSVIPSLVGLGFVLWNIAIGCELYRTSLDVNKIYNSTFKEEELGGALNSIFDILPYFDIVILVFPIFRVIVLVRCIDKLSSVIRLNR